MIESVQLSWTLSVLFAVTGMQCLSRCLRTGDRTPGDRTPADRVAYLAHFLMSAAMVAMIWPWGMNLPIWPQATVFTLAAIWFVVVAVAGSRISTCELHFSVLGRWHNAQHAALMGVMVWMLVTMPASAPSSSSGGSSAHHGSSATPEPAASEPGAGVPVFLTVISLVLAAYCVFQALRWISGGLDASRAALNAPGSGPAGLHAAGLDALHHAAMSVGMAVMLAVLT